jgi:hypothetical protein
MTQDSNRSAQVPWGQQPSPPPQPAWWHGALTVPGLLAHIVIMLGVTSLLTVVNLLAGPRVWWSLAILVIWLALVIIHAIGVGSRSLLFVEDSDADAGPASRPRAEPIGPAVPGWLSLAKRNGEMEPHVPESWVLPDDTPEPPWTARIPPKREEKPTPAPESEKVPWRAATDIAWLRRPKPATIDDNEPPTSNKASS